MVRGGAEIDAPADHGLGDLSPDGRSGSDEPILTVLAVCDEWLPAKGGLTAFNRLLCSYLAAAGHRVFCLVERATEEELADARANGVSIVRALDALGPNLYLRADLPTGVAPNLVIGHDRVSGRWASVQANVWFPESRFAFLIHSVPHDYEFHKPKRNAASIAEGRDRELQGLAASASVVYAVGPRLARMAASILNDGFGGGQVVQLDPGIDLRDVDLNKVRVPSPSYVCLLVGRAEQWDVKGVDIAALAFAALPADIVQNCHPVFWIRGAETGKGKYLHDRVCRVARLHGSAVNVREYSSEPATVSREMRQASVVLMPSRAEGYGLVGLEAIAQGTPALISDKSGLAEQLQRLGRDGLDLIVPVSGRIEADVPAWSEAIARVLRDRSTALARADRVRERLSRDLRWNQTVQVLLESADASRRTGLPPGRTPRP